MILQVIPSYSSYIMVEPPTHLKKCYVVKLDRISPGIGVKRKTYLKPPATLRETNSLHLKMDGWNTSFCLGPGLFSGAKSWFQGG